MAEREYRMVLCYNGNKDEYEDILVFDSRREWRFAINTMPFDVLDEDETTCWVDYGDNDSE